MPKQYTIGALSNLFGISGDSMRYYEKMGAIKPKRGANGYRLYSIQDVWRLNVIRDLLSQGVSMQRINQYLNGRSIDSTLELLCEMRVNVDGQIAELTRQKKDIMQRENGLRMAMKCTEDLICKRHFAKRSCYQINEPYSNDAEMDVLMQRLIKRDVAKPFVLGNVNFGSYVATEAIQSGRYSEYSGVFVIDAYGDSVLPDGNYLCVTYHGTSQRNSQYIPQLLTYARAHALEPTGVILEMLLTDIHVAADETEHIFQLQLLCEDEHGWVD